MLDISKLLSFVEEDAPFGDITTVAVVPDVPCRAVVRAGEPGVAAGIEEAAALFSAFGVAVEQQVVDGTWIGEDDILLSLSGRAHPILLVERTALNLIGRMSGIATKTKLLVDAALQLNLPVRIAATRKTCPGIRHLDKKAVIIGGGDAHRFSLSDQILIKDNHLALRPLADAVRKAKEWSAYRKVEVEIGRPEDAVAAARAGADIIMLDNMDPDTAKLTILALEDAGLRSSVLLELSGGIDEESIERYAGCDVDMISVGALTHSVKNIDVSLDILPGAQTVRI